MVTFIRDQRFHHAMVKTTDRDNQPQRSKTRREMVLGILKHPSSAREILTQLRRSNPSISYQDLGKILKRLSEQSLVVCLNPAQVNGRIYVRADAFEGQTSRDTGFWNDYGAIVRGRLRKLILLQIAFPRWNDQTPVTVTQLQKNLRWVRPFGFGAIRRAIEYLHSTGVIETVRTSGPQGRRTFGITKRGRRIAEQFNNQPPTPTK